MMKPLLWAAAVLSGLTSIAVVMAAAYAIFGRDLGARLRGALWVCLVGHLPALIYFGQAIVHALLKAPEPFDQDILIEAAVCWIGIGPIAFLCSAILVRPLRAPWRVDTVRGLLVLGWASSSFFVVGALSQSIQ
jgi:hypothetical protein